MSTNYEIPVNSDAQTYNKNAKVDAKQNSSDLQSNEEKRHTNGVCRLVNGKFYFPVIVGKSENCNQYEEKTNQFEEIWKLLQKENKEVDQTNENSLDYEKIKESFDCSYQINCVAIIAKINMILKKMHQQLDKANVIPDLGNKIDDELNIIKQMLDLVFKRSNTEYEKKEADGSMNFLIPITIEFAKFGFWQIFTRNIALIADYCVAKFEKEIEVEELQAEFHSFQCDSLFVNEAEKSLPASHSNWSYRDERLRMRTLMRKIVVNMKKVQSVQLRAAEQQSYSFQLLQQQQAQLHAIQQQQYGGASTNWNIGIAYRPPDSIFNISAGYQQGKANIQISMVPDEQASLLGATGFTAGVGPGNLGLSLNLNI